MVASGLAPVATRPETLNTVNPGRLRTTCIHCMWLDPLPMGLLEQQVSLLQSFSVVQCSIVPVCSLTFSDFSAYLRVLNAGPTRLFIYEK